MSSAKKNPGGNRGARRIADAQKVAPRRPGVNKRAPSAWRTAPGHVRIQVHEPNLAESLQKIAGRQLAGYSVLGGYLRIFSFPRPLSWAERWITRHTPANEAFSEPNPRLSVPDCAGGSTQREAAL